MLQDRPRARLQYHTPTGEGNYCPGDVSAWEEMIVSIPAERLPVV